LRVIFHPADQGLCLRRLGRPWNPVTTSALVEWLLVMGHTQTPPSPPSRASANIKGLPIRQRRYEQHRARCRALLV
jgi:hypothetical protein